MGLECHQKRELSVYIKESKGYNFFPDRLQLEGFPVLDGYGLAD